MDIKYILKIFVVTFLILSLIVFINTIGLNLNEPDVPKKLLQVVTVEGMTPTLSGGEAFCEVNKGFALEQACNKLTRSNCGLTSCCVYTSDNKCKAGNASGPLFNSDENGKTQQSDYYYFQSQCYGTGCPS